MLPGNTANLIREGQSLVTLGVTPSLGALTSGISQHCSGFYGVAQLTQYIQGTGNEELGIALGNFSWSLGAGSFAPITTGSVASNVVLPTDSVVTFLGSEENNTFTSPTMWDSFGTYQYVGFYTSNGACVSSVVAGSLDYSVAIPTGASKDFLSTAVSSFVNAVSQVSCFTRPNGRATLQPIPTQSTSGDSFALRVGVGVAVGIGGAIICAILAWWLLKVRAGKIRARKVEARKSEAGIEHDTGFELTHSKT